MNFDLLKQTALLTRWDDRSLALTKMCELASCDHILLFSASPNICVQLSIGELNCSFLCQPDWQNFLQNSISREKHSQELFSPHTQAMTKALGLGASDGSVVAFLGNGEWNFDVCHGLRLLAPLISSALRENNLSQTLSLINEVGHQISAHFELQSLIQKVTDAATKLSQAQVGAFYYNTVNSKGVAEVQQVVSGDPQGALTHLFRPHATAIFSTTFASQRTVRCDDNSHLPVRSYLAVPLISPNGEDLGGLFLGHKNAHVFTAEIQEIVEGLAAQASVAIENAKLYKKLQESIQARDEFLSIASHELKTPLTSLKLQTQMRARTLQKNNIGMFAQPRLQKMLESDTKQIERLSRLIDDMLDMARINTGKLSTHLEKFDLSALTREVVDRYRPVFENVECPISFFADEPVVGVWDKFRIEQVITNLLINSHRYGNGKAMMIDIQRDGEVALLSVEDHGIGIAQQDMSRIFERFERAISANEMSGLGLGLYIVKEIVKMHRGSIEVNSELGKGSTFTIKLPLSCD